MILKNISARIFVALAMTSITLKQSPFQKCGKSSGHLGERWTLAAVSQYFLEKMADSLMDTG